jgi:hypothetical protein
MFNLLFMLAALKGLVLFLQVISGADILLTSFTRTVFWLFFQIPLVRFAHTDLLDDNPLAFPGSSYLDNSLYNNFSFIHNLLFPPLR